MYTVEQISEQKCALCETDIREGDTCCSIGGRLICPLCIDDSLIVYHSENDTQPEHRFSEKQVKYRTFEVKKIDFTKKNGRKDEEND